MSVGISKCQYVSGSLCDSVILWLSHPVTQSSCDSVIQRISHPVLLPLFHLLKNLRYLPYHFIFKVFRWAHLDWILQSCCLSFSKGNLSNNLFGPETHFIITMWSQTYYFPAAISFGKFWSSTPCTYIILRSCSWNGTKWVLQQQFTM